MYTELSTKTSISNKKGETVMGGTIRARVHEGVLEPLDTIDLPEGKEVTITILDLPMDRNLEAFRRSHGGWKGTLDAEALIRNIRESRQVSTRPEPRL
jgi:predicted DNA-binding antitoxin AbrB/MazE fold protein